MFLKAGTSYRVAFFDSHKTELTLLKAAFLRRTAGVEFCLAMQKLLVFYQVEKMRVACF